MCTCRIIEKIGINPTWYTIECTNNLGKKKFYSFAMANDESAKMYAETVLCQDDKAEGLITDDMKQNVSFLEQLNLGEELEPALDLKASYSFLQANPSVSVSPKITITQSQIYINHSTNCDNSKITGTSLFGENGGGYFLQNGVWNIPPGVYTHKVQGTIYGYTKCEIKSQLNYY